MILVAFDLETTGLDPRIDQILQIGAVAFNPPAQDILGKFERVIRWTRYSGDAVALSMNTALLLRCAKEGVSILSAIKDLEIWLEPFKTDGKPPVVVGFNVAPFDLAFLHSATDLRLFHHRAVELGTLFIGENGLPESSKEVVGNVLGRKVAHDAVQDATDAAELYMRWWSLSRGRGKIAW